MKGKSFWFLISSFLLSVASFASMTHGFQGDEITSKSLALSALILLGLVLFVWYRYVDKPTSDFLQTITRAIHGDYQARFSCCRENDNFCKLSVAFNRLISLWEEQTNVLSVSRKIQNQLYENEKIYRSALELTCERLFEADLTHNRVIYGLAQYKKVFPFLDTEMFDDMIQSIAEHAIFKEDAQKYQDTFSPRNLLEAFRVTGAPEITLEYRQKLASGELVWLCATVILMSGSGDTLKVIGYVKNIDERKKQELELLKQSQKDGLTGIYNKRLTQSLTENFIAGCGKNGRHTAIMIDIDNFKKINDTLGHIQGDRALFEVARKLSGLFRSTDIVGRIGGDEFFVLMKDYSSSAALKEKLDAVKNLFSEIALEDTSFRITGSIGVSLYPRDGSGYQDLYKKADIALYYAKAHGKNQYCVYPERTADQGQTAPREKNDLFKGHLSGRSAVHPVP